MYSLGNCAECRQFDEMNEKFNSVVNNCHVVWRFVSRNEPNQWRKTVISVNSNLGQTNPKVL